MQDSSKSQLEGEYLSWNQQQLWTVKWNGIVKFSVPLDTL